MTSNHILKIFRDYLKTENTSHAILINGGWGSGKTFFWKYSLTEVCEELSFKSIYISLNGINKIESLDYQLKIKLIPFLNKFDSKKSASLINILKNTANTIIQNKYKINPKEILKDVEIDVALFANQIICFDDLERCTIPLANVLGYINNFVEHKNVKVIILSDETKIDKTNEKYNSIKEKVIGRVLNFNNDFLEVFPFFITKYKGEEFYNFLCVNQEYIVDLFEEYHEENLRKLSFYLDILYHIYPYVKNHIDYQKEIILFCLVITIEFKNGNLTTSDYNNYKNLEDLNSAYALYNFRSNSILNKSEPEEKEESYHEQFYKRFLSNQIDHYFFYRSIYVYILTGYLDEDQLKDELQGRIPIVPPIEEETYRKIATNEYRGLTNEEFQYHLSNLLKFAKEGRYKAIDYLQMSKFLNFYSDKKLLPLTTDEIRKILMEGLDVAKNKISFENNRDYSNFGFFQHENDDAELFEVIKEFIDAKKKDVEKKRTSELIVAIENNDTDKIAGLFKEYEIRKELFENLDVKKLYESLAKCSNTTISLFGSNLEIRYNFGNVKDYLAEDYSFLNELMSLLKSRQDEKTLHDYLITELIAVIEKICQRLA